MHDLRSLEALDQERGSKNPLKWRQIEVAHYGGALPIALNVWSRTSVNGFHKQFGCGSAGVSWQQSREYRAFDAWMGD